MENRLEIGLNCLTFAVPLITGASREHGARVLAALAILRPLQFVQALCQLCPLHQIILRSTLTVIIPPPLIIMDYAQL